LEHWVKKLKGPIEAYMKETKTIIILREREKEYDYKLMESRKWLNTAFDGVNFGVKLNEITPEDVPEVMLMGMTRTNISPKGE